MKLCTLSKFFNVIGIILWPLLLNIRTADLSLRSPLRRPLDHGAPILSKLALITAAQIFSNAKSGTYIISSREFLRNGGDAKIFLQKNSKFKIYLIQRHVFTRQNLQVTRPVIKNVLSHNKVVHACPFESVI